MSDIRVVTPTATPEEIAAVTVVLTQALDELADALGAEVPATPSAWERSRRNLRSQLATGPGAWRGFSG